MSSAVTGLGNGVVLTLADDAVPRPSDYGSEPDALDARSFLDWSDQDQLDYIQLHGQGTPPTVTIGTPGGQRIIATLNADGASFNVVYLPDRFDDAPETLDPRTFATWLPDQQLAYVKARGTGTPPSLKVGANGTPQIVVTANASGTAVTLTYLVPSIAPGALDAQTFRSWLPQHQLAYVEANGAGNPKSVMIGTPSGDKLFARIDAFGLGVSITMLPAGYDKAPADLDASTFLQWNYATQRAYVDANGTGSPKSVTIGRPSDAQVVATASSGTDGPTITFIVATLAPDAITPEQFLSWAPEHQVAYVEANGQGSPKSLVIGTPAGDKVIVQLDAAGTSVNISGTLPDGFNTVPAELEVSVFLQWNYAVQEAYLLAHGTGTPKTATIGLLGEPKVTATYDAGEGGPAISYIAADVDPDQITPQTFMSWTQPHQLAYIQAYGSGMPKSLLIGTSTSDKILVSLNVLGTDFSITQQLPPEYGIAPTALDAAIFLKWGYAVQQAYVLANGTGSPPTVRIGLEGEPNISATANAGPTGPTITYLAPDIAPGDLDPDTFLSWSVGGQLAYIEAKGSGTPKSVTIGTAGGAQIVASVDPFSGDVSIIPLLPPGYTTAPDELDVATFLSWNFAVQQAYVVDNGTGSPPSVRIGAPDGPQIDVTFNSSGNAPAISYFAPNIAPDDLTADQFLSWSPQHQLAYVEERGEGVPKAVLIGPSGEQLLARIDETGAGVTIAPLLPPEYSTPPEDLDPAIFLTWNTLVQLAYVAANGSGSPKSVLIGTGNLQITAKMSGSNVAITYETPDVESDALSLATFLSWPAPYQRAYVRDNGEGTPKMVLIGTGTQKALARFDSTGTLVETRSVPADFAKAPELVDPLDFLTWDLDVQIAYVRLNTSGIPTVRLGTSPGTLMSVTAPTGALEPTYSFTPPEVLPEDLDSATFLSWPPDLRKAYVEERGEGTPLTAVIGTDEASVIIASLDDGAAAVEVSYPPDVFFRLPNDGNASTPDLDPDTFLRFSSRLQLAYLLYHGDPKTFGTTDGPRVIAELTTPNSMVMLSYGAPNTDPEDLSPIEFLSWPEGVRLAYVNAQGDYIPPATSGPKQVTIGDSSDVRALTATTATATVSGQSVSFLQYDDFWGPRSAQPPVTPIDATETNPAIPYYYLPGSDVGIDSPAIDEASEALFPRLDGDVYTLANKPEGFTTAPASLNPKLFLGWHSAAQLEYIKKNGTGTPPSVVIGAAQSTAGTTVTAVVSSDGYGVYVIEHLQKQDFATMSIADQLAISQLPAFADVAKTFGFTADQGLILNGDPIPDPAHPDPNRYVGLQGSIDKIMAIFNPVDQAIGYMTPADRDIFVNELKNIKERVTDHMAIYSVADIKDKVSEIMTRFNRALEFAKAGLSANQEYTPEADPDQWKNVISLDGGAAIAQGYRKFIEQESRILQLDDAKLAIATTGTLQNKKLDVPSLVFLLQLQYNLTVEAKSTAETEEINQQNALLKTYGLMQQLIQSTMKVFNHTDPKDTKALGGQSNLSQLTDEQAKVASMFEDLMGGFAHPLETLRGITRPKQDMFTNGSGNSSANPHALTPFQKSTWEGFANQLNDTVTLINQESQIKMNDINSLDKEKSRNFDLANSALQKMNEVIQNIARSM